MTPQQIFEEAIRRSTMPAQVPQAPTQGIPGASDEYTLSGYTAAQPQQLTPQQIFTKAAGMADTGIEQMGFVENFQENLKPLGHGLFQGIGRTGDMLAQGARTVDRAFGGDGENFVANMGNRLAENADRIVQYSQEGEAPQSKFQQTMQALGTSLPSTGLTLAGGQVAPILGAVQAIAGDALGEGGNVYRQNMANGADSDVAFMNSSNVVGGNMALNALLAPVNPLLNRGQFSNPIAGAAANAVKGMITELPQESSQTPIAQAGITNEYRNPLQYMQALPAAFADPKTGFLASVKQEGIPAALSGALMGSVIPGNQIVTPAQQPQTEEAPAPIQEQPAAPAPAQPAFTPWPRQYTGLPERQAPAAPVSEAPVNNQPPAPQEAATVPQNAPTNRDQIIARAEAELETLTGDAQLNEDGTAANSMTDRQLQRYAAIQQALVNGDTQTLEQLLPQDQSLIIGGQAQLNPEERESYDEARYRMNMGEDSDTIRQATGWFIGPDQLPRREIPDNPENMALPEDEQQTTLSKLWGNPDLFRLYPQLANRVVRTANLGRNRLGTNSPQAITLGLDAEQGGDVTADRLKNYSEMQQTLAHEVQHDVQFEEGFTPGTNEEDAARRLPEQYDSVAIREAQQVLDDPAATATAKKKATAFIQQQRQRFGTMSPFQRYERAAGEWEARQVADRLYASEEDRAFSPAFYPPGLDILPTADGRSMQQQSMGSIGDVLPQLLTERRMYHGSENTNLDRISNDFLESGEGTNAHGAGAYLAESPNNANMYTNNAEDPVEMYEGKQAGGRIYETDIPDADQMLDYDKLISKQSKTVRAAILNKYPEARNMSGRDLYAYLKGRFRGAEGASKELASLGIPGAQYMEESPNGKKAKMREVVMYDDNYIEMLPTTDAEIRSRMKGAEPVSVAQQIKDQNAAEQIAPHPAGSLKGIPAEAIPYRENPNKPADNYENLIYGYEDRLQWMNENNQDSFRGQSRATVEQNLRNFREQSQGLITDQDETLYTGSPTHFEGELDTQYLGSGQGAARHGSGFYLSRDPQVSTNYALAYGGYDHSIDGQPASKAQNTVLQDVQKWARENNILPEGRTKSDLNSMPWDVMLEGYANAPITAAPHRSAARQMIGKQITLNPKGQLATFTLPAGTQLLDEYAALDEQPDIMETLNNFVNAPVGEGFNNSAEAKDVLSQAMNQAKRGKLKRAGDGKSFYDAVVRGLRPTYGDQAQRKTSELLASLGIKGLNFRGDVGWSSDPSGNSSNAVIFENGVVKRDQTLFNTPDVGWQKMQEISDQLDKRADRKTAEDFAGQPIYDDVVKKFKAAGMPDADAQTQGVLYQTGIEHFAKFFNADPSELWRELGIDGVQAVEELRQPDGTKAAANITLRTDLGETSTLKFDTLFGNSTFPAIHETGHFFTELIRVAAKVMPQNQQLQDYWDAVKAEVNWGADQGKYARLNGPQHERMANGFANYFKEGKAPNKRIKRVFDRLKAWVSELWSALPMEFKIRFAPETRKVFDAIFSGDAAFESTYSQENTIERTGNNPRPPAQERGLTIEPAEAPKPTNNQIMGAWERFWHSPSVIAERYNKFKSVYIMGDAARREADSLRQQYSHSIDKVFGRFSLARMGRTEAMVTTEEDRQELFDIMLQGDALGEEFSNERLKEMGVKDNVIQGYRHLRNVFNGIEKKVNAQRNKYNKSDMGHRVGYVPHFFHNWRVYDSNGRSVNSFDNLRDAVAFAGDGDFTIRPQKNDFQGSAKMDAVTVGDTQYHMIISKMQNVFALNKADAQEFAQDVIRTTNKSRVFNNAKQRSGVGGFDTDMEYAVRHYANYASRYIAMDTFKHDAKRYFNKVFGRFENEFRGVASYTKNYINDVLGVPAAMDEMQNKMVPKVLVKFMPERWQDRPMQAIGTGLERFGAVTKLGFMNFGSALMNYSSLANVSAIVGYGTTVRAATEALNPTMTTRKIYQELQLDSDVTQESESRRTPGANIRTALGTVSGGAFQFFDNRARRIAAIAGYRDGLAQGMTHRQALTHAREIVNKTNFDYSVADAPEAFRRTGPVGRAILQFQKYPIKLMELGINHLEGIQRVRFWGNMIAMGGLLGAIPGFALISSIARNLFDDEDLELEAKNALSQLPLPDPVKESLLYGALSQAGIDVGRRLGWGDTPPDIVGQPSRLIGPGAKTVWDAGVGFLNALAGINSTTDMDTLIDLAGVLVPGIANPVRGLRGGVTDDRGRQRSTLEGRERLLQGLGLRPIRTSIEADAVRINQHEKSDEQKAQAAAIDAYIEDPSPENRARLRELRIDPNRVIRARQERRKGTQYERALGAASTRQERDRLLDYGSMGQ
jgi:hypothetical protein